MGTLMDAYNDKNWLKQPRNTEEYWEGATNFVNTATNLANFNGMIKCPCKDCGNILYLHPINGVFRHLVLKGMDKEYAKSVWIFHGEGCKSFTVDDERTENDLNEMNDMLHEAFWNPSESNDVGGSQCFETEGPRTEALKFAKLVEATEKELYPGCKKFTKLSCIVRMYHLKYMHRWSDSSFADLLTLLKELLPDGVDFPNTFYQVKKIVNELRLGYRKIDACPNDCMLYWKESANDSACTICGTCRWVSASDEKIPAKILRHFPVIPRLKRLYMSSKTSGLMKWHEICRNKDGKLRHPADSLAWQWFNNQYPNFAQDCRNIRIGLASDGFNPFGVMNVSYSIWPVIILVYNLPPWDCTKEPYIIMSLLIPGPKAPDNDIDIYLQPLIDELKLLWEIGVDTYDFSTKKVFKMHAALLWAINDFPAYGNLSGWTTKGRFACPHCNINTCSQYLSKSRKMCYMGHRRFLDDNHKFRRNKSSFNGKVELRQAPRMFSGSELLHQMKEVNICFGKAQDNRKGKKRKRHNLPKCGWKKRSIFFDLPYWEHLLLRHNLDVMHIEKNVCGSVIGTLLDIEGKTKDSLNARLDLKEMKIKSALHPTPESNMPNASFTMNSKQRSMFCKVLSMVRLPDGYASNISKRVDSINCKVFGLKSHDCHIIMQYLLPMAIRKTLPREVSIVVIQLSNFFLELCSKVASVDDFEQLENQFVTTLCRLVQIFPPAFFDVMVHLPIHLAYEAAVAGPVLYRWMYSIERYLHTLKSYVRNKARPEGSIAEAYVAEECMNFCSRYIQGVESKENRSKRNRDGSDCEKRKGISIFSMSGVMIGHEETEYLDHETWKQAHQYVLFNCDEVAEFVEEHITILNTQYKQNSQMCIEKLHKEGFHKWFQENVEKLRQTNDPRIFEDLIWLSKGPRMLARNFKRFNFNGLKFRTYDIDNDGPTQNSGISVKGTSPGGEITYYGILKEMIELDYNGDRKVVLFKCDWANMTIGKGINQDELGFTLVNFKHLLKTDEPFVLASQVLQVIYTPNPIEA